MKKLHQKIKALNLAYVQIRSGVDLLLKNVDRKNGDIDTYVWRIEKAFKELNREICKQLKRENLDEEFKRITKDLL